jgi:hypothetical protein
MALRDVFAVISDGTQGGDDGFSSESSYSPSENFRLQRIEERLSNVEATIESLVSELRCILVTRHDGDSNNNEERKGKCPRVGRDRAYWGKLHPGVQSGPWYAIISALDFQYQPVFDLSLLFLFSLGALRAL